MTHTIEDAEAAIARHPESLEELSKAADLLIEREDPRGEDFAKCLAGDLSAEEVQRRHPADVSAMFVAAWAIGSGIRNSICGGPPKCRPCSNNAARAEALRVLAACGKVGDERGLKHDGPGTNNPPVHLIPVGWFNAAYILWDMDVNQNGDKPIGQRLRLLDAYAAADPDTRRRWAEETRALTPVDFFPLTLSAADSEFLSAIHDAEKAARAEILRGLAVPADVLRGGSYINSPGDGR